MKYTLNDGFLYYIELVGNHNYKNLLQAPDNFELLKSISEENASTSYATNKWTIKQIIGHVTDHERIMTYRALRFSRKDRTPLPGYDQNVFVENANFNNLSWNAILSDFENVRKSTISFINNLSDEQLHLKGIAWKYELTIEEFMKATIGHELHHMNIIRERYLK